MASTEMFSDAQAIVMQEIDANGVLRLTLNDEGKRNALSQAMLGELQSILDQAAVNAAVRVIVIAAIGPAFCAGHDLKEMTAARSNADRGRAFFTRLMASCASVMQSIVNHPKPVIAEVQGVATAAGCQLVASCDLAYAAPTAKFATPGVHIGLFCSTPMVALSRNVANKHAMEMLLTGDVVDATAAADMGLINQVVEADQLSNHSTAVAHKIAAKSSMTLATGKRAFYHQRDMPLADAYAYSAEVMVENMLKRDAEEGISAFIEKRPAQWHDK